MYFNRMFTISFSFSRFIYPVIVTLLVSTMMFPKGPGMLVAGEVGSSDILNALNNYILRIMCLVK